MKVFIRLKTCQQVLESRDVTSNYVTMDSGKTVSDFDEFPWTTRSIVAARGDVGGRLQDAFQTFLGGMERQATVGLQFEDIRIMQLRLQLLTEIRCAVSRQRLGCVQFESMTELWESERCMALEVERSINEVNTVFSAGCPWPEEQVRYMVSAVHLYQMTFCYFINCGHIAVEIARFLREHALHTVVEVGSGRCVLGLFCRNFMPTLTWIFTDAYNTLQPALKGEDGPVLKDAAVAAGDAMEKVLVLCWPLHNDDMASRALAAFRGDFVIYLGEGRDGCTGDSAFFDMLEREWIPLEVMDGGRRSYDPRGWAFDLCWCLQRRNSTVMTSD